MPKGKTEEYDLLTKEILFGKSPERPDLSYNGLDLFESARYFLWGIVGNKLRKKYKLSPLKPDLEVNEQFQQNPPFWLARPTTLISAEPKTAEEKTKTTLFIPFPFGRLNGLIEILQKNEEGIQIMRPAYQDSEFIDIHPEDQLISTSAFELQDHTRLIKEYLGQLTNYLSGYKIKLDKEEKAWLTLSLQYHLSHIDYAEEELKQANPDAILIHTDNHPPFINYVLIARKLGIKSIMLQHGLDCERYILDEAFASHIAVWGKNRKERYLNDSTYQPQSIEITGNPEWDERTPLLNLPQNMLKWLWVTRPHKKHKCYLPSQNPLIGVLTLNAILTNLADYPDATLTIKAHYDDNLKLYEDLIAKSPLHDRVQIKPDWLGELLKQHDLVLSEDSTAGLEALIEGLPLIHLHFAQSEPVLPFSQYGAGFLAKDTNTLKDALLTIYSLPPHSVEKLQYDQKEFIHDFATPANRNAASNAAEFIASVLTRT